MTTRFATDEETAHWDDYLANNSDGGNVFQSTEVAETKRQNGWMPRYLFVNDRAITVLEKPVFAHGAFWYLPKGPGSTTVESLLPVLAELKQFALAHGVFAIKIEPEIIETDEAKAELREADLIPTNPVQPNVSTVIVDLRPNLDTIMASFNQKGRNAIRRAERDGVTTKPVELTEENMQTMFNLLAETAAGRFDSSLRSFEYYKTFWQSFAQTGHGSLFFAYFEGEVVAGAYAMYLGHKGLYKDGASLRDKVTYGASHLLQWEVIRWMRSRDVTSYDLCGSPHSNEIKDKTHPFYGIGRFKTQFNREVTDYVGCYDLVVNPRAYARWQKFSQRMVISLSYRLKRQQWF